MHREGGRPIQDRAEPIDYFLRYLWPTAYLFAIVEAAVAVAFGEPRLVAMAVGLALLGAWIQASRRRLRTGSLRSIVTRLSAAILVYVTITALFFPSAAATLVLSALIPVALALTYVTGRSMYLLVGVSCVAAIAIAVAAEVAPRTTVLPAWSMSLLRITSAGSAFALISFLMWQSASRLRDAASELRGRLAMSGDLARTLDPQRMGDLIASHLARSTGATECSIATWDRSTATLVRVGHHPPERGALEPARVAVAPGGVAAGVLDTSEPLLIAALDAGLDETEAAVLRSRGHGQLLLLPLVAKGGPLGLARLSSAKPLDLDTHRLELARTMASEAAMVLDNARLYQELRHQAFHDGLTGLANRALFRDRLQHALARASRRAHRSLAVLFLDLDDFKSVNDSLGHDGGDQLLTAVAERLSGALRTGDTAARLGGDEFGVLLEDLEHPEEAVQVAQRLLDSLRTPFGVAGSAATISGSIGIAQAITGGETVEELLRDADFAMYRAKANGHGTYEVFRPSLRRGVAERNEMRHRLAGAADRGELRLHYQPIVDLRGGAVVGVEALVRWRRSDGVLLRPADFIPLAEESGAIMSIGAWVLQEACRQAAEWQRRPGQAALGISVNLSARQFQHHDFVDSVRRAMESSEVDPTTLVLELTESVMMQNTAGTAGRLAELRRLGVRVAIDDFGTGYSSLSYLERFPVDVLKIDRSFVNGIADSGDRPVLGRAIAQLGHALQLDMVAEGIERPDQLRALQRLGCQQGQGFLFSAPVDADALTDLLGGSLPGWSGMAGSSLRRRRAVPRASRPEQHARA